MKLLDDNQENIDFTPIKKIPNLISHKKSFSDEELIQYNNSILNTIKTSKNYHYSSEKSRKSAPNLSISDQFTLKSLLYTNNKIENDKIYTGRLKFFDEIKNYGFIIKDDDDSDVFAHYEDLSFANVSKKFLKSYKFGNVIYLKFNCFEYFDVKNRICRKANNIRIISNKLNLDPLI